MTGWQEPKNGKRMYIVTDNTKMTDFNSYIHEKDKEYIDISFSESKINLGIHIYKGVLYSSNLVGVCRVKKIDGQNVRDTQGNEVLLKVIPRFDVGIVDLLNYVAHDDEFDRYMAPQTRSNRQIDKDIEAIDENEIFCFFENEKPLRVNDTVSNENSIITVTAFLSLLYSLCKRPLMGRMLKHEINFNGKVKGKVVVEKNINFNTIRGRNDRFYCRYLRYTDNIIENQILKAALKKAKRFVYEYFGVYAKDNNNYASMISYCSNALRNIDDIKCSNSDCDGLRFTGCYVHYKPTIALAKMIINDISIESNGNINTSGYIVPYAISMEKLFEVYVRTYLKNNGILSYRKKALTGIQLEKYDQKIDVLIDKTALSNSANYISGPIKPDIILTDLETHKKSIFDVKYKDYNNSPSRNDRLQLLAYSMMLNADNIGIIFPAFGDAKIFDASEVNSMETRTVKYHQLLLNMKKTDDKAAAEYIKENAFRY